jgi:hypothetical protein
MTQTSGGPDLSQGDSGEWVSYLQQMLNHYYQQSVVPESGDFDETTANTVQHFRQQSGLADGTGVDTELWEALLGGSGGSDKDKDDSGGTPSGGPEGEERDPDDPDANERQEFEGVEFDVALESQPDDTTCWAASMIMVLNARGGSYTVESLCEEAGVDHEGKTYSEALPIGTGVGMYEVYCACWLEDGWAEVLKANGPLWTPVPGNEYHIIVVAGIRDNGEAAEIHVLDPWPAGSGVDHWMDFKAFTEQYEMGEGYGGNLLAK